MDGARFVSVDGIRTRYFEAGSGDPLLLIHGGSFGYFENAEEDLYRRLGSDRTALLQARLPQRSVHESLVTGKRYTAAEAVARQIVDEVAEEAAVLPRALEIAAALAGKTDPMMAALKRGMYAPVLEALAVSWERQRR